MSFDVYTRSREVGPYNSHLVRYLNMSTLNGDSLIVSPFQLNLVRGVPCDSMLPMKLSPSKVIRCSS